MKSVKKLLLVIAMALVMLGLSANNDVQAANRQKVYKIQAIYNEKVPVPDGRKCTDYFVEKRLKLDAYALDAKGNRLDFPVKVAEKGTYMYAKNGKITISLKCKNKVKKIVLKNVIPIKSVVIKKGKITLVKNKKLTPAMAGKQKLQVRWKNGRYNGNYKGYQCLDIGKTIRGSSCKIRYRIKNRVVSVRIPVKEKTPPKEPEEHQHIWGNWTSKSEEEHERACLQCGSKNTQPHRWGDSSWKYIGEHTDAIQCIDCSYQKTREHIHEEVPEGRLEYVYHSQNDDGTHKLVASYICEICNEEVFVYKDEKCQYDNLSYKQIEGKDQHAEVRTCKICQNSKEDEKNCEFDDNWQYIGDSKEAIYCQACKKAKTRQHRHGEEPENLKYVYKASNKDGTHCLEASYICVICHETVPVSKDEPCKYGEVFYEQTEGKETHLEVRICEICQYRKEEEKNCEYDGKWQYIGNATEAMYCQQCSKEQTRVHQHEEVPEGLEYVYKFSNGDGTHCLEASYICGICHETVTVTKNEDCQYELSYEQSEISNTHKEVRTCKTCQNRKEEQKDCEFDDNWEYIGNGTEAVYCKYCNSKKTIEHIHEPEPENLEYVYESSNGDGTHVMVTSYICKICKEEVTLRKIEECQYELSYEQIEGESTTHKEIRTCKICQNRKEEQKDCEFDDNWQYIGNGTEAVYCKLCNKAKTKQHVHDEEPESLIYVCESSNEDGTHKMVASYICIVCGEEVVVSKNENCNYILSYEQTENMGVHTEVLICEICQHCKEEEKNCEYDGTWQYIGNATEAMYCLQCNKEQTRKHQHEPEPEGLLYVLKVSNRNGTHRMESSYTCNICQEMVIVSKNESCQYGELFYVQTGVNDVHIEARDCQVCQYRQENRGTCVPTGELKQIKVGSQIYDYYDCALCGDWCNRSYHTEHHFGNWEYRDSQTHIRYCVCVEAREIEEHNYIYNSETCEVFCDGCGDSYEVEAHNHGYNTVDEMGLMDIISSPAYGEILSASQKPNPNISAQDWCSRYEFQCKICGVKYYIHYAHKFVDGVCTRKGYCGGIAQIAN